MTKNEEIIFLIKSYNIKLEWLANAVGLKSSILDHFLTDSKEIAPELYSQLKTAIGNYQYELDLSIPTIIEKDSLDLFDDTEIKKGIGERMRIFAKRRFKHLNKLAEAMNIAPQQLQQYIAGNREPGAKILVKLMKLGCDINWLLGGNESFEDYKVYKLEKELKRLYSVMGKIETIAKDSTKSISKSK